MLKKFFCFVLFTEMHHYPTAFEIIEYWDSLNRAYVDEQVCFLSIFSLLDSMKDREITILPNLKALKLETVLVLRKTNLYNELHKMAVNNYMRQVDLEIFIKICLNDIYLDIVD